jgi:V/A-type H+-transporting ATPase subunit B
MFNWKKIVRYTSVKEIKDPIMIAEGIEASYGDIVYILTPKGVSRKGRVIAIDGDLYFIEVFEGTSGLDRKVGVRGTFETVKLPVSELMLGRIFDGKGESRDDKLEIFSNRRMDINGSILNPYYRKVPSRLIETGISSIDLLNSIVVGQKLALFSPVGAPLLAMIMQIMRQSIQNSKNHFVVVMAGIGLSHDEENYITTKLEEFRITNNSVLFLNSESDPAGEALLAPRNALTAAEYFAFEKGYDVFTIIGDMTNYADTLRNLSAAKEELTVRQGYPSYLFSDLASIYERCGLQNDVPGSITQLPFLTMPNDDITHPVPDTTGYISEGQLILNTDMHNRGVYPPLDILTSLSRMMHFAMTNEYKAVSDKVYNVYAEGQRYEEIATMMGLDVLDQEAKGFVSMKDRIDAELITQDENENRTLKKSIEIARGIIEKKG